MPTACRAPPPKVHRPSSSPARRTEGAVQFSRAARGLSFDPTACIGFGIVFGSEGLWCPPEFLRSGSCERSERAPAEMMFLRKVSVAGSGAPTPEKAIFSAGE